MGKVIILSGVSGAGKSTYARKLWSELEPGKYCEVFSADDYFKTPSGYHFNAAKLRYAHGWCFRNYIEELRQTTNTYDLLIIDNTNTTVEEIAPYMLAASAYEWEAEVHTLMLPSHNSDNGQLILTDSLVKLANRNVHGVPFNTLMAQNTRLHNRMLPRHWKAIEVPVTL